MINNLNTVLGTVDEKGAQFDASVDQLQQLITGLAQGRDPIAGAIPPLASAANDLTDMLQKSRRPMQGVIENVRPFAQRLDDRKADVNKVIEPLAENYLRLNALGAYGSFFNIFYCSMRHQDQRPRGQRHPGSVRWTTRSVQGEVLGEWLGPTAETRCAQASSASRWWRAWCWSRSATPACRSGRRARTYEAYFTDAGGITPGNDVNVSGINVGKVTDVALAGDTRQGDLHRQPRRQGRRPVAGRDQDRHRPRREVARGHPEGRG